MAPTHDPSYPLRNLRSHDLHMRYEVFQRRHLIVHNGGVIDQRTWVDALLEKNMD